MPRSLICCALLLFTVPVGRADDTSVRGTVQGVDEARNRFALKRTTGKEVHIRVDRATELKVDGKEAKLADLKAGQEATVLMDESSSIASRVVSRTPKPAAAPESSKPASATKPDPDPESKRPTKEEKPAEKPLEKKFVTSLKIDDDPKLKAEFDLLAVGLQEAIVLVDKATGSAPDRGNLKPEDLKVALKYQQFFKPGTLKMLLVAIADETGVQGLLEATTHAVDKQDMVKIAYALLPGTEKQVAIQIARRIKEKGAASLSDTEKRFVARNKSLFLSD